MAKENFSDSEFDLKLALKEKNKDFVNFVINYRGKSKGEKFTNDVKKNLDNIQLTSDNYTKFDIEKFFVTQNSKLLIGIALEYSNNDFTKFLLERGAKIDSEQFDKYLFLIKNKAPTAEDITNLKLIAEALDHSDIPTDEFELSDTPLFSDLIAQLENDIFDLN